MKSFIDISIASRKNPNNYNQSWTCYSFYSFNSITTSYHFCKVTNKLQFYTVISKTEMVSISTFPIFLSIFILLSLYPHYSLSQNLTATITSAKLPYGVIISSSAYDGQDSIYIFGGLTQGCQASQIIQFFKCPFLMEYWLFNE